MSISTITIGSANYMAYASVAEADEYLAVDPVRGAAWGALNDDGKGERLVMATRRLNLLNWKGKKTGGEAAQVNAWPRSGVVYPDGEAVPETGVPRRVEDATILLAGSIAVDPARAEYGTDGTNVKSVGAGAARVTFFRSNKGVPLQERTSYELIKPFLQGGLSAGFVSGVGAASSFADDNRFGRDRAFP